MFPFLEVYLGFGALVTLWELYLDRRQLKKNQETEPPAEIKELVPLDRFTKSQVYQVDKLRFSMLSSVINFVVSALTVVYLWPVVWEVSKDLVGENEYYRAIVWQLLTSLIDYPITIPMSLYKDFVLEERHGFNKKTISLFFFDLVKSFFLSVLLYVILIPIVVFVVHWGGEHFYLYIWVVCQCFIFIFMMIYPTFIMPLFNKFETLRDEVLRKQIEDMAAGLKYPLSKLFQMDGSKRSSHSNAFLFGFWKNKRIVLFDTLLQIQITLTKEAEEEVGLEYDVDGAALKVKSVGGESTVVGKWNELHKGRNDEIKVGDTITAVGPEATKTELISNSVVESFKWGAKDEKQTISLILGRKPYTYEEILAILGHEIGHWFHGHVLRMLVVSSVHIFVIFRLYAFCMYSSPLFVSFGFDAKERSVWLGLNIFLLMFSPVEEVCSMGMTVMTRMNEYQADDFAVKQNRGGPLGSGLNKLCVENLGDLNPDPVYAWFHHSHPGLVERLRNIKQKTVAHESGGKKAQ